MLDTPSYIEPIITYDVKVPVTVPVVSLTEMKAYMRVDFADDDTTISSLIDSASMYVESMTGYGIGVKTISLYIDSDGYGWLPLLPVNDTSVVKLNTNQFDTTGIRTIDMSVGYSPTTIPGNLKVAIMKIVATNYEFREDFLTEGGRRAIVNVIPDDSIALIKQLRRRVGI